MQFHIDILFITICHNVMWCTQRCKTDFKVYRFYLKQTVTEFNLYLNSDCY